MKEIKFRLLFDGSHTELENRTFDVSAEKVSANFKLDDLIDINKLQEYNSQDDFDTFANYFSFPGFSLYYVLSEDILFIIAYRDFQQRHQLYERGFFKNEAHE